MNLLLIISFILISTFAVHKYFVNKKKAQELKEQERKERQEAGDKLRKEFEENKTSHRVKITLIDGNVIYFEPIEDELIYDSSVRREVIQDSYGRCWKIIYNLTSDKECITYKSIQYPHTSIFKMEVEECKESENEKS